MEAILMTVCFLFVFFSCFLASASVLEKGAATVFDCEALRFSSVQLTTKLFFLTFLGWNVPLWRHTGCLNSVQRVHGDMWFSSLFIKALLRLSVFSQTFKGFPGLRDTVNNRLWLPWGDRGGRSGCSQCFPPKHTWHMEHLPVWEHWILNVQSFTPRLEPADVLSRLSPERVGAVPGWGEGSAVQCVGRVAPAERLVAARRCVRSRSSAATLLLLLRGGNRPQRPPGGPPAVEGGAVARAEEASHLEEHRCSGFCFCFVFILRLNFQASSQLLPVFLPAGEGLSSCRSSHRRHVCRRGGKAGGRSKKGTNPHNRLKECEWTGWSWCRRSSEPQSDPVTQHTHAHTHTHTHTGGQPRTRFKVSSSVGLHPSCSENRIYFILTQSPNAIKPMARVFIMRTNNQLSSFIVLLFFPLHHTSLFTRCSIKVSGGNIAPPVRNTQKRLERYFWSKLDVLRAQSWVWRNAPPCVTCVPVIAGKHP